jgi:hypothetical protein
LREGGEYDRGSGFQPDGSGGIPAARSKAAKKHGARMPREQSGKDA